MRKTSKQQQIRLNSEWTTTTLDPAEDGAHYLPGGKFFEWWYFDAHLDNGYHLVVALHTRIFSIISRPAVITVHLYGPGGRKEVSAAAFGPQETASTVGKCEVQLGASRVWDAGEYYGVHIEQGSIRAELEYRREIPGVQVGTGVLFENPVNEQSFNWIVPLPRARVSGYLWIDGQRVAVSGLGYHDHNWGNLDLYRAVRRWTWGRVIADKHTMIFWDIFGHGTTDSHMTGAILWQESELSLHTHQPDLQISSSSVDQRADVHFLNHIGVFGNDKTLLAQTTLQNQQVLDKIDFAQPRSGKRVLRWVSEKAYFLTERVPIIGQLVKQWVGYGTYYRLLAECNLQVATECYNGSAFYEMMDFEDLR